MTIVADLCRQITCNIMYAGLADFCCWATWAKKYISNDISNYTSGYARTGHVVPSFLVNSSMRARFEARSVEVVFVSWFCMLHSNIDRG